MLEKLDLYEPVLKFSKEAELAIEKKSNKSLKVGNVREKSEHLKSLNIAKQ